MPPVPAADCRPRGMGARRHRITTGLITRWVPHQGGAVVRLGHLDFLDFSRLSFLDSRNHPQTAPMRSSHRPGWMMSDPMPGNFLAPADPDSLLLQHMIEESLQAGGAARMTSDAQMHADGHHLGLFCPFAQH